MRITEINYHPAAAPPGSPYTDKDFEFLEVQNTGTNTINLAGARLGGGIDFTFAPSQWVPAGASTSNNFDSAGTPLPLRFSARARGRIGPTTVRVAPRCACSSATRTIIRNRIAFDQTATGVCQRVIADFDFRASSSLPAATNGTPTLQDFDSSGTAYTLAHNGTEAPVLMAADSGFKGAFLRMVPSSGAPTWRHHL